MSNIIRNKRIFTGTGGSTIGTGNTRYGVKVTIAGSGDNVIAFSSPFVDSSWDFDAIPLCIDSLGNVVVPTVTNYTANGFTVNIGDTGTISYLVIHS